MVTEHGPSIGKWHNRDIPAYIVTDRGRWAFARIAMEVDGGVELSQLADDECLIAPGLIYKAMPR